MSAVRAELTKIRTLRAVWVVLAAVVALQLLVEVQALPLYADAVARITPDGVIEIFAGEPEPVRRAMLGELAGSSLQMTLFLPCLAAVVAGSDARGRPLGQTLLAVPRPARLIVAKTVAAGAFLLLPALLIAGISTMFAYLALRGWHPGVLLGADVLAGRARFVAYAVLLGLTAHALTIIARGTLGGIVAGIALPAATMTRALAHWPALDALLPLSAGRNLLLDPAEMGDLTSGPGRALAVLAGWALVTTALAGLRLARR